MRFQITGADRNTGDDVKVVIDAGTANDAEAIAREKGILLESVVPVAGQRPWFTKPPNIVAVIVNGGLCALTVVDLTGETRSQSAARSDTAQLAVHAPSDFCVNLLRTDDPTIDCKHVSGGKLTHYQRFEPIARQLKRVHASMRV